MSFATVPELLEELRQGRMVVIVDDEDRENEGDLIMVAELVKPSDVNFMVTHARGLVCLSLTRERCKQLGLPPMVRDNTSQHHTNFTVSIEAAEGVTTGISAYDRAHTIRTAVRPDTKPQDLSQPGHIFPLQAQPGGVLARAGHTEAAGDLAMMAGFEPAGVLVEILNADGTMARRPELEVFAQEHGLKMGSIEALIRYRLETEHTVERIESRPIDTPAGEFLMHVYRDRVDHQLHFALQKGTAERDRPSLVRVHTRNTLADALHWLRGDFGVPSLEALHRIAEAGHGALVVLGDAESSETVLARLRQETLPDTSKRHPASAGWRQNGTGSQILADLGYGKLRVLGTARKQVGMAGFGLEIVENVPVSNG